MATGAGFTLLNDSLNNSLNYSAHNSAPLTRTTIPAIVCQSVASQCTRHRHAQDTCCSTHADEQWSHTPDRTQPPCTV